MSEHGARQVCGAARMISLIDVSSEPRHTKCQHEHVGGVWISENFDPLSVSSSVNLTGSLTDQPLRLERTDPFASADQKSHMTLKAHRA